MYWPSPQTYEKRVRYSVSSEGAGALWEAQGVYRERRVHIRSGGA